MSESKDRYLVLSLYSALNLFQSFQCMQYTIIANVIESYYHLNDQEVNLTSIVNFMAVFFLMIPSNYLLSKIGIRNHVMVGTFLIFLGSIVKCFAIKSNRFYVTLFGQSLVAISGVILEPLAPHIARIWYSSTEASRATAVGLLSVFTGNLLSMTLPPILVPNSRDKSEIEMGLNYLLVGQASIAALLSVSVFFGFKSKPEISNCGTTSANNAQNGVNSEQSYFTSLITVMNKDIVVLMIVAGIWGASHQSLLTILNEFLLPSFDGKETLIAMSGFLFCLANIVSTFFFGYLLDKKQCFKACIWTMCVSSLVLFFLTYLMIEFKSLSLLIIISTAIGFTLGSWSSICVNFAAELTHPQPEYLVAGLLLMSAELMSALMTIAVSFLLDHTNHLFIISFYCISMLFAILFVSFIRNDFNTVDFHEKNPIASNVSNKFENFAFDRQETTF